MYFSSLLRRAVTLLLIALLLLPEGIFAYPYTNPAVNYSTGTSTQPYGLVAIDFNGDNYLDFATANLSTSTVSVMMNDGDGTFAAAVQYAVGTNPRALVAKDFNGDGEIDLATANASSSNVSVLMGNGDGTFDSAVNYPVDANRWAINAADLDNDGDIDIATAGADGSGTVSVILNNGSGVFGTQTSYAAGAWSRGVFFGHFDNDLYLDMAVPNQSSSNVSVFINDGDGTFGSAANYSTGADTGPRGIGGEDFNGDGEVDIVTANFTSGTVSFLAGNGDGTFDAAVQYAADTNSLAVLVADLNGDGEQDLAVANYNANNASILISNGDGTFDTAVDYAAGTNPRSMIVGQLDNADNIDFAVVNGGSHNVSVYLSSGAPILPVIDSISSNTANGSYGVGQVIDIDVTFSKNVTSTGGVLITLETGATDRTCSFTIFSSNTGTCNYTVQSGDTSSDLTVSSVSGSIVDGSGGTLVNFIPTTNLSVNKNIVIETISPTIQTLSPADGATSVSASANLVITFDEAVDVATGNVSIYKSSDDSLVEAIDVTSGLVSGTGTTSITLNPSTTLTGGIEYYILIAATAFDDLAGNSFAGITSDTAWNFTVADSTSPSIQTLSPADGTTSVSASANLVITFDEAVNVGTGNVSIYKASDDSLAEAIDVTSALASGTGTTTITLNPSTTLSDGIEYYVLIAATAFDDLAGNSFAGISSDATWNFTIASIASLSSSSSSTTTAGSGGGGGHRGTSGPGGQPSAERAKQARLAIAERFNLQMDNSSEIAKEEKAVTPVARKKSQQQMHAASGSSSNLHRIAQQRGRLVALVESEEILFRDVVVTEWYAPYIASLIEDDVAHGYRDAQDKPTGEFGVANSITRAEVLKMAMEAAGKKFESKPPRNPSAQGTWAAPYVGEAERMGLTVFSVEANVNTEATRGEVMQILLEVMGLHVGKVPAEFLDVPANHPFSKAISTAAFYGIVEGDTDSSGQALNTFRPDDKINRAEVAKIIALLREIVE